MLELRQFNLQLAFPRAGPLREDVENQRGAVQNLELEKLLQVAGLRGGKLIVENDRVHVVLFAERGEFARFAFADVGGGIGRLDFLRAFADDFAAGGGGQFPEFVERFAQICCGAGLEFQSDEEDPFRPGVASFD